MSTTTKNLHWHLLLGISLLSFTSFLNTTIISTALPDMQQRLNTPLSQLQWVMIAFFLGFGASICIMKRISDSYSRRKVFFTSLIIFGLASIGAGLSTQIHFLICFRVFQGISTAAIMPISMAIIQPARNEKRSATAMTIYTAITSAGFVLGPLIGGALTTAYHWPAVFFINIPFVIIGFCLCYHHVEESIITHTKPIDYLGTGLLAIAMTSLVYGLVQFNTNHWHSGHVIHSFIVSFLSIIAFIITEKHVRNPIFSGQILKNRTMIPCALFSMLGGGATSIALFIDPLYIHNILEEDNWSTGSHLFALCCFAMMTAYIISDLYKKLNSKQILLIGTLCYFISAILHRHLSINMTPLLLLTTFIFLGVAWGIANTVPQTALKHATVEHLGTETNYVLLQIFYLGAAVLLALSTLFYYHACQHAIKAKLLNHQMNLSMTSHYYINLFINQPGKLHQVLPNLKIPTQMAINFLKNSFIQGFKSMQTVVATTATITLLVIAALMPKETKPSQ